MSYSRFGWDDSDVYVYLDVGGYLSCCGCWLSEKSHRAYSTDDMVAHLVTHQEAGHTVPTDTLVELVQDAAANDAWIESQR